MGNLCFGEIPIPKVTETGFLDFHHAGTANELLPRLLHTASFDSSKNVINVGRHCPDRVTRGIAHKQEARIARGKARNRPAAWMLRSLSSTA